MKRRNFLPLLTLPVVSTYSWAQKYPSSPSTIIMPLQAGSASDVAIRHMAERLTQKLGQGFVVENVAAAAGLDPQQPRGTGLDPAHLVRRSRSGVRWCERLLWHGPATGADALEPPLT